jgi:hypothetical protein
MPDNVLEVFEATAASRGAAATRRRGLGEDHVARIP